ncbi:MAG TPA: extracellular solute-binding protein [Phycisphaerales bacterium]|nr:extracellular solute-binding protein [Phycisphaerales bacterium]
MAASRSIAPRRAGLFMLLGLMTGLLCACSRESAESAGDGSVVLYSSADDFVLREMVEAFGSETGLHVRLLGDTEATKTTGLVQRLLSEKDNPRADVWWSSEPFGTIRLAREGLFESATGVETGVEGGWPLVSNDGLWLGFASRARVIAYHTGRVREEDAPRTLRDLIDPRWRGRVGIARPEFGTTRGHFGALVEACGVEAFEAWLAAMKANGVRLYSGNASAVRGIADGEIDVCLTDTDDVWVAQRNGWPIGLVYERPDGPGESVEGLPSFGPLLMPNTVALVRGGPGGSDARRRLVEFLLSERGERILAESDSGNIPLRPGLAAAYPQFEVPSPWVVDYEAVADADAATMEACRRVLGGG